MSSKRKKKAESRKKQTAVVVPDSRDRHRLYEIAVQCPEADVEFFDRVYARRNGRPPLLLKEDFCGTALLCAEWVRLRPENRAWGVDLDGPTLAWGQRHNVDVLAEDAKRIELRQANALHVRTPKVDVVAALNFSYCIFKTRDELRRYYRNVRASLRPGGMIVMDLFGGWEAQMENTDDTRHDGFTYVWEQEFFDPVSNHTRFHIHFRFPGKARPILKAFTYDWRLWTIPEIRELLAEAGFSDSAVYWEGFDSETGEGDGEFREVVEARNSPGWNALVVAFR